MALTKEQRTELVEKVVLDCRGDPYNYADFVSDCVQEIAGKWEDEDLIRWVYGDDQEPNCVFCEDKTDCVEAFEDCQHNPANKA